MSKRRKPSTYVGQMAPAQVTQMVDHAASGASGVHADQLLAKRSGTGRTNRVASRSAAKREAIRQQLR